MAKIYLYFGQPLFDKGLAANEQFAFNQEVSIETANIRLFKTVMGILIKKIQTEILILVFAFTPCLMRH